MTANGVSHRSQQPKPRVTAVLRGKQRRVQSASYQLRFTKAMKESNVTDRVLGESSLPAYGLSVVHQLLPLMLTRQLLSLVVWHSKTRTVNREIQDQNVIAGRMPVRSQVEPRRAAPVIEVSRIDRIEITITLAGRTGDKEAGRLPSSADASRKLASVEAAAAELQTARQRLAYAGDRLNGHDRAGLAAEFGGQVSCQNIHRTDHFGIEPTGHCRVEAIGYGHSVYDKQYPVVDASNVQQPVVLACPAGQSRNDLLNAAHCAGRAPDRRFIEILFAADRIPLDQS